MKKVILELSANISNKFADELLRVGISTQQVDNYLTIGKYNLKVSNVRIENCGSK